MKPLWHIDKPVLFEANSNETTFHIQGWVAALNPITDLKVETLRDNKEPALTISMEIRDDVPPALGLPTQKAVGFGGECSFEQVKDLRTVNIGFQCNDEHYEIITPVYRGIPHSIDNKASKLDRLLPILQCPVCLSGTLKKTNAKTATCEKCSAAFPVNDKHFDFLSPKLRESFNIIDTENVSSNPYDGTMINLINKYHDGLILDCGAGCRDHYYDNVVNYEIVSYDSTDVLGVGEVLPFKDETFDAVFSCAVLEHVKDPFQCAKEIKRVLKKGRTLYCQLPFLQPFHGYPHHYYNATQSGLRNLFEDTIEIETIDVLDFGQPIALLNWFLGLYASGLPEELRAEFGNMTVNAFLKPVHEQITQDYVTKLSPEMKNILACCNYMIGQKR